MPRLLNRADVGYGFPTPTAGDRGAGQQAVWDAVQALGVQTGTTTTVTSSRSLTMSDCGSVLIDATVGNITLTLPQSGTSTDNACFTFVRLDASANAVTIQCASSDTIEGVISIGITLGQRRSITIPAGTTVWRVVGDSLGIVPLLPFLQNYLRNAADITASGTTLTIPATQSASNDNVAMMTVGTTFTKTTAIFAIGTGLGGLDSGAVTVFTDYFLYQVRNPSTGVVDYAFSLSSSAPVQTGALAGFTQFRRLPVLLRTGATATQWAYVLNQHLLPAPQILGVYDMAGTSAVNIYIPSPYRNITLRGEDMSPSTSGQQLQGQLLNNATPITTADYSQYSDGTNSLSPNAIGVSALTTAGSFAVLGGLTVPNTSPRFTMDIDTLTANRTNFNVSAQYQASDASGQSQNLRVWAYYAGAAARNGIRLFSGSNFNRGRITVMGTL